MNLWPLAQIRFHEVFQAPPLAASPPIVSNMLSFVANQESGCILPGSIGSHYGMVDVS